MVFSLNDQCQLVLFCPTNKLNQVLQAQTGSQPVFAWLVRTQYAGLDRLLFESAQSPSALMFSNSERLHGKVEVGQYDWRHKNLFHVGVDLAEHIAAKTALQNGAGELAERLIPQLTQ